MADLTARPDHWTDSLPGNWQQAINTNGILNALGRALSRQSPDMTRGIEHDQYGSVSDRNWLLEAARGGPPKMNPLAAEMLDKGGLLANFLGPGVKLPAAAPKPTGIRAYHGSPHDFDRFDINKIGTGEGAQAYGRGLYFAESEGVAKSYRDALKPLINTNDPRVRATQRLRDSKGDREDAIAALLENAAERDRIEKFMRIPQNAQVERDAAELLRKGFAGDDRLINTGRMYEVRINADPEQFLDWDKPVSGQPSAARPILEKALSNDYYDANAPIGEILRGELLKPETATALREAGVPGTRYLDQSSRRLGEGTRNTVVWDDKLIEILRKYGIWPLVPAGTAAALNQQEPPL